MSDKQLYEPKLEALKIILDARRHEIDLVWKRGLFFWGFVALAFAAAAASVGETTNLPSQERGQLLFLVSLFGMLVSFAWYLSLRGSKFWQETWEARLDSLEPLIVGKIFTARRIDELNRSKIGIFKSGPYSVSKLAIFISLYVQVCFLFLFIYSLHLAFDLFGFVPDWLGLILFFLSSLAFGLVILFCGNTQKPAINNPQPAPIALIVRGADGQDTEVPYLPN